MFLLMGMLWLVSCVLSQDPVPLVAQLPTSIIPIKYMYRIEPNMDSKIITGAFMMQFNTTSNQSESLTSITMHLGTGSMLVENTLKLLGVDGILVDIAAVIYDDFNSIVKFLLSDGITLKPNYPYMLSSNFQTPLTVNGVLTGSLNSTSKYFAFDFRATNARNVLPCLDEPRYKVRISLQVVRPADHIAVSTADLYTSSDPDADNMVLDTFALTDPIPIHGLGLFISQLTPVTSMGVNLLAPQDVPTIIPELDSMLSFIQSNLGPFPTGQLNLVVLPDQRDLTLSSCGFAFISLEIYTGEIGSSMKRYSRKLQLTEALLRQYLEYNKTPQWWSDIWLSEAVGAFLAVNFQPEEFQLWYQNWIKNSIRSDAVGMDIYDSRGPIVSNQPLFKWDIENLIASKTIRNKGLSVLSMWNDTMPEGLVLQSILGYMNLTKSIVNTNDLLDVMVANIVANTSYDVTPAIPLLPAWLNSSVFPQVGYWSQNASQSILSQSPGCPSGSPTNTSEWQILPISISYTTNDTRDWENTRMGLWMINSTMEISSPNNSTQKVWTIFNLESAPFRVNYNEWEPIINDLPTDLGLNSDTPTSVRTMLQLDSVGLSLGGCLPFSTSLTLLVSTQRDQLDWIPVVKALEAFTAKIANDSNALTQLQMYASILFPTGLCYKMDLMNSTNNTDQEYAREVLTHWLCKFHLCNCREAVAQLYEQLLQGNTSWIEPSDRENVACEGARYNNSGLDTLIAAYSNTSDLLLKHLYKIALSCLSDPQSVQTVLDMILSNNSSIDPNDAKEILVGQAKTLENSGLIINFVVNRAYEIQNVLGVDTMSNIIDILSGFRVDLTTFESLNDSPEIHPYVKQKAVSAMLVADLSSTWWNTTGRDFVASLPQIPTTSTASTPMTTTSQTSPSPTASPTPPSSAKSLLDVRVFCLVATAAITAIAVNL